MSRWSISRYFCLVSLSWAMFQADGNARVQAADIESLRAIFRTENQRGADDFANAQLRLMLEYRKALQALQDTYQQQGDLDTLMLVRKESERFEKDKSILKKPPVDAPTGLASSLDRYCSACSQNEANRHRRSIVLMQAYTNQLVILKNALVQQRQLHAAVLVNDEIQKMDFEIADTASKLPQESRIESVPAPVAEKKDEEAKPKPLPVSEKGAVVSGNVALASAGAVASAPSNAVELNDRNSTKYTGSTGFASGSWPCEISLTFPKVYQLKIIRFLLWDQDPRYYRYTIDVSADGKEWTELADRSKGKWRSWQEFSFPPRPVKSIRVKGLYNSANSGFYIVEMEAFCTGNKKFTGSR